MIERETIVAPATAQGRGALAIIRVSGKSAFTVVRRIIKDKKKFQKASPRYITLYQLINPYSKQPIDEVTAVKYRSPISYTGENMVEIICHGGPLIVQEITEAIVQSGARLAGRGEFSKRALENGKMDLLKAEAIKGLIESVGEADLVCAKKLYYGEKSAIQQWKEKIIEIISQIEAEIEFGEEEDVSYNKKPTKKIIETIIDEINIDRGKRNKIKMIEKGIRVVIAGPANAGKSTLFNKLLGFERALIHNEPGTTRDLVTETVIVCNHEVLLIDCAGIRKTQHEIESEGIKRTRHAIEMAGLLIWVTSADEKFYEEELDAFFSAKTKKFVVINKSDLDDGRAKKQFLEKANIKNVIVSLVSKTQEQGLFSMIEHEIEAIANEMEPPEIFLSKRLEETGQELKIDLQHALKNYASIEIAAYYLKKVLEKIEEMTGKTDCDEVINKIFENFCIGK